MAIRANNNAFKSGGFIMAWVQDWNNLSSLYSYGPFLEELRVAIVERTLDPSTYGIGPLSVPLTNLETIKGQSDFFQFFDNVMSDMIGAPGHIVKNLNFIEHWGLSDFTGEGNFPYITEASMMTQIGDASRVPPPINRFFTVVFEWMIQQYKMLNELLWVSREWVYDPPANPNSQRNTAFNNNAVFLTAYNTAKATYDAQSSLFNNTGEVGGQILATAGFFVQFEGRIDFGKSNFTTSALTKDIEYYTQAQKSGTSFGALGSGYTENKLALLKAYSAVTDLQPSRILSAFTDHVFPLPPTPPPSFQEGWVSVSPGEGGGIPALNFNRLVLKFDVVGGFTKVT